jgi:hypothetical protein
MADAGRLFAQLIQEAIEACGPNDMACIVAHVEERAGSLAPDQRVELQQMIERVLGFQEPQRPFKES